MLVRSLTAVCLLLATAQDAADSSLTTFRNYNQTFQIDLPEGWRQLGPNEAVQLGENPKAPGNLRLSQPRRFYAVGPVEAWLAGDFSGPWLYIVEQRDQWYIQDDFAEELRRSWQRETDGSGVSHELAEVRRERVGSQAVECVLAHRTSTPPEPQTQQRSLDVHAPTGRQQITLSFSCAPEQFSRWQPEFRRWLDTLTFARTADEQPSLTDRLWTPILTGAVVGIVLLLLYKHTRGRR